MFGPTFTSTQLARREKREPEHRRHSEKPKSSGVELDGLRTQLAKLPAIIAASVEKERVQSDESGRDRATLQGGEGVDALSVGRLYSRLSPDNRETVQSLRKMETEPATKEEATAALKGLVGIYDSDKHKTKTEETFMRIASDLERIKGQCFMEPVKPRLGNSYSASADKVRRAYRTLACAQEDPGGLLYGLGWHKGGWDGVGRSFQEQRDELESGLDEMYERGKGDEANNCPIGQSCAKINDPSPREKQLRSETCNVNPDDRPDCTDDPVYAYRHTVLTPALDKVQRMIEEHFESAISICERSGKDVWVKGNCISRSDYKEAQQREKLRKLRAAREKGGVEYTLERNARQRQAQEEEREARKRLQEKSQGRGIREYAALPSEAEKKRQWWNPFGGRATSPRKRRSTKRRTRRTRRTKRTKRKSRRRRRRTSRGSRSYSR